ncbi:DUF5752 family protein [Pyrobaculum aerophilum]|uniref:Uncharacterized protein n=1 Tax=Pyrobaculum aerophilum TaxID=13773 RepID=A0A371QVA3_9CREN|nr:DUF5752 family protein [Pyrobaculum aerophilum]RFA93943.1 hypothetical protein CGL51_11730 [Pyrobaculum aerophilum]RFA98962.1 hypothetical protein CGL52_06075 [Pyrobaculum aerophilum]
MKLGAKALDTSGRGEPFKFYTAYYLSFYSKKRARTLRELLEGIKIADKNTLFHHLFHTIRSKHLIPPRYSNDFARWVGEEVGDEELAAALSDISGAEPATIEDIRKEIIAIMEPYADDRRGKSEFVFVAMEPVVIETDYVARTLGDFLDLIEVVPGESVIYHFVTRRVLEGTGRNDFSIWLEKNFGLTEVAAALSKIDPLMYNSEEALRRDIIKTLRKWLL